MSKEYNNDFCVEVNRKIGRAKEFLNYDINYTTTKLHRVKMASDVIDFLMECYLHLDGLLYQEHIIGEKSIQKTKEIIGKVNKYFKELED